MGRVYQASMKQALERIDEIRARAAREGYAIIRGAVSEEQVQRLLDHVRGLFDPRADVRRSGEYRRDMEDFHRLDLGEYGASTRFARYFMFFPWNQDLAFGDVSVTMMDVMRGLAGKGDLYASGSPEDTNPDRYRISYVIQYPTGGGFMSKHREYTRQEEDDHAFVLTLALTTRGKDFSTGGAYLHRGDEKLDVEASVLAGDLLVYRGDLFHGVEGVDPDKPVVLDEVCGRIVLLTTTKYFGDSRPLDASNR